MMLKFGNLLWVKIGRRDDMDYYPPGFWVMWRPQPKTPRICRALWSVDRHGPMRAAWMFKVSFFSRWPFVWCKFEDRGERKLCQVLPGRACECDLTLT